MTNAECASASCGNFSRQVMVKAAPSRKVKIVKAWDLDRLTMLDALTAYIRSVVWMPSRPRPVFRTRLVASQSVRRVLRTVPSARSTLQDSKKLW